MITFQVLISKGVAEPVCCHTGMAFRVAMVVDAVHHHLHSYTSPFLLLLAPSAGDMESIVSLAASYLGNVGTISILCSSLHF